MLYPEDFATYIEVDPSGRITVTHTRAAWTLLKNPELGLVYKDFGADYFSGSFKHLLTMNLTGGAAGGAVAHWCLTNVPNYTFTAMAGNFDFLALTVSVTGAWINIQEGDGANIYLSTSRTVASPWYMTLIRDEFFGSYGRFYYTLYSDAKRTIPVFEESLTLHSSKKDFRYLYACQSMGVGLATYTYTGYTENLILIPSTGKSYSTSRRNV